MAKTTAAFLCTGSAMEKRTARTAPTSQALAKIVSANRDSSSAPTKTAPLPQRCAMASMTAAMAQTNAIATLLVQSTSSSAIQPDAAFWARGSAMETTTAAMDPTKIPPSATLGPATRKRSLPAKTDAVSRNLGTAIRITTAETARMNRRTFVDNATARLDGSDAPSGATTAASRSGSSATAKMIVAMVRSNFLHTKLALQTTFNALIILF